MPWQMPIQDGWQVHLLHQRQEHHKVIDALGCYRQFFFHTPQYAREFLFCLAHYANGENYIVLLEKTKRQAEAAKLKERVKAIRAKLELPLSRKFFWEIL